MSNPHHENVCEAMADRAEIERLTSLVDRLKLEAQVHAQEARTANATIYEIYQLVTGGKGEPGNWNGARPVAALVAERDALRKALEGVVAAWVNPGDGQPFEAGEVPALDDARAALKSCS